jgi:hypothetical protein
MEYVADAIKNIDGVTSSACAGATKQRLGELSSKRPSVNNMSGVWHD